MDPKPSYPDPEAAHGGMHPFSYAAQPPMPPAEHAHAHMQQAPAANMRGPVGDGQEYGQINHNGQVFTQNGQISREAQPATPQQLAQRGLDADQSQGRSNVDSSARKRAKVTRACDECRRKKIRCDAESETPGIQCSACKRADQVCDFRRAPQKRGPSKGYIKELAERVNRLENSGATPPDMQYAPVIHDPSGPGSAYSPPLEYNRHRNHGMMMGQQNFEQDHQELLEFSPGHRGTNTDAAAHGLQGPRVLHPTSVVHQQTRDTLNNMAPDPSVYDYGKLIQPFFPVLARQESRVHHELEKVPSTVRTALLHARDLAVTCCTSALKREALLARVTSELAALKAEGPQARACDANFAYLQALFFMAIVTENSGPGHSRNTSWIAEAVSIATYLNLHQSHAFEMGGTEDEDSSPKVARRVWLSLIVLDRFHASSTASPLLVAEDSARLVASDEDILGPDAYHLVRISLALGHVSHAILYQYPERNRSHPRELLLDHLMKGEIDRLGEGLYQTFRQAPHLYLAFAHLKLLSLRLPGFPDSITTELLDLAYTVVDQLSSPIGGVRPLTHHFAGLAAITLAENMGNEQSVATLQKLRAILDTGYVREDIESSKSRPHKTVWNVPISSFISKKLGDSAPQASNDSMTSRGGLQHLADAAVGNNSNGEATDWTAVGAKGFLNEFE